MNRHIFLELSSAITGTVHYQGLSDPFATFEEIQMLLKLRGYEQDRENFTSFKKRRCGTVYKATVLGEFSEVLELL